MLYVVGLILGFFVAFCLATILGLKDINGRIITGFGLVIFYVALGFLTPLYP